MKSKHLLASILCCMIWFAAYSAETEPNDTKAQANTLLLNGSNTGAIGTATDVDWWKVTTNKDGQLNITLTISNSLYCEAALYDNNGTTLLTSNNTSTTVTFSQDGLANGSYYIKVYPYNPAQMPAYTISNTLTNAVFTNDAEPNDTKAAALTLAQNATANGHIGFYYKVKRDTFDWYKVTTSGDGKLRLHLSSSNNQYVWAYLYDNDGTTLLNSNTTFNTVTIDEDGLAAGTYYIMIKPYYPSGFAPYTITDSLFPPAQANDVEPNNTAGQALTLAQGGSATGHVGYYYNAHRDTADWYKVVTDADGELDVTITSGNGSYVWVYLCDNDGATLLNSTNTYSTITLQTDGLAAGTYYVKVISYFYNTQFVPYTLSNALLTYANGADPKLNDVAAHGITLPTNNTTAGHVGFINNGGSRDLIDWWKINYTGSGNLTVTLNWEPMKIGGAQYMWLVIYKDTAADPIYSNNGISGTLTANLTLLTQGYYYVKVLPYYASQWAAYNLTPTFTQTNCVTSTTATTTHSGKGCTNSYITFKVTGGLNQYVQLYRYGVSQGKALVDGTGSHKFDNLAPGNYYAVGFSDGATGGCQATSATVTVVPKPKDLTATNITSSAADINWTTFSCVQYYFVQYRILGTTSWKKKTTVGNVGTYHISGLTNDTTYEYRVAANDSANGQTANGKYSAISTFGTLPRIGTSLTSDQNDLSVYPNPVSSTVHVSFENGTEGEVTTKLFDVNGKTIFIQHQNEASGNVIKEIDLSSLNTGVYELQIITADGSILNQSIVKMKE